MKTKEIKVTERDIKLGIMGSSNSCPVARAICRSFKKKLGYALVGALTGIDIGKSIIAAKTPDEAQDFIRDFDNGETVNPFTFTLNY